MTDPGGAERLSLRGLAWTVAGLGTVALLISPLFAPGDSGADVLSRLGLALGLSALPIAGALIVARLPRHPIGWILCGLGVGWGVTLLSSNYVEDALARGVEGSMMNVFIVVALISGALTYGVTGTFLFLLFPSGHFLSRRWRIVGWIAAADLAIAAVAMPLARGNLEDFGDIENPFGLSGRVGDVFSALSQAHWVVLILLIIMSVTSLIVRFRRSRGVERQQLKWVLYAGVLLVTSPLSWAVIPNELAGVLTGFSILAIGVAIGIAILRFRLYDIDVIVNRTLVYLVLSAALATAYVASIVLSQSVLPLKENSDVAVAASTLAVAALFRPARRKIQSFIDRRFYRRRYNASQALEAFARRLQKEIGLESVQRNLIVAVLNTMDPVHASLWLPLEGARAARQPGVIET